ncbi:MAG: 4Fe-4S binding protein [Bacteroidota bacterium]|nr:4Fe-4S binding protein [Bacteroidota bacterium]
MNVIYISLVILLLLLVVPKLHRKRHTKNRAVRVVEDNCTRCRSCLKKCRHDVLDLVDNGNGMRIEVNHPDRCTGCGDCVSVCRFNALEFVERV